MGPTVIKILAAAGVILFITGISITIWNVYQSSDDDLKQTKDSPNSTVKEIVESISKSTDFITLHPNVYKYPECGFQEVHNYSVSDFPLESENNVLSRWKAMMTMLIADNSDTKCIFTVGGQGEDRICPYHIGDHKCHDFLNTPECGFDDGDCCEDDVGNDKQETCFGCICYQSDLASVEDSCQNSSMLIFIGDGLCDDENNNIQCFYDGGDCCFNVIHDFCTNCSCYLDDLTLVTGMPIGNPSTSALPEGAFCAWSDQYNDGWCDDMNNVPSCNYDGGDCCLEKVENIFCTACACHENGVAEIPTIPTIYCPWPELVNDGQCDDDSNWYFCGYDGGDCCQETPIIHGITCDLCLCINDEIQPECKYPYTIGNLYCDPESNNIDCSYDGGDCCLGLVNVDCVGECECHSNALDDEDAECYFEAYVGDGYCNDENNYQSCGFDGGDCCLEQVKTAFCYECLCLEDGGIQNSVAAPTFCPYPADKNDGFCDDNNNVPSCDFDGGDCCLHTWNWEVFCIACKCHEDEEIGEMITVPSYYCTWDILVSDGFCDDITNNLICGYDGGDCCLEEVQVKSYAPCVECTCFETGPNCKYPYLIANKFCDPDTNTLECHYDGGDCCDGLKYFSECGQECNCHKTATFCPKPYSKSDGWCDDYNNVPTCDFDGGDCCLQELQTYFCTACKCHEEESGGGMVTVPRFLCGWEDLVNDGFCDDVANNYECGYDGGDCCLEEIQVKTLPCVECTCFETGPDCKYSYLIANGYCDSDTNISECHYDGGDCCDGLSYYSHCGQECNCHDM